MRIHNIEITNYKAFLGTHKINVGGKNLFIYGENGSGKSSLYYALKDFWKVVKDDVTATTKADIEKYRALVLNPFSHYNTEQHEIKTELGDAIEAVKKLKQELAKV